MREGKVKKAVKLPLIKEKMNIMNGGRIHKQKLETVENQSAEKFGINRYLENQ